MVFGSKRVKESIFYFHIRESAILQPLLSLSPSLCHVSIQIPKGQENAFQGQRNMNMALVLASEKLKTKRGGGSALMLN